MAKRIDRDRCCAVVIDVQTYFLSQVDKGRRAKIRTNTKNFVRLIGYFGIPIVVTLERPLETKGALPHDIEQQLRGTGLAATFEKNYFDLTREKKIRDHLARLKKRQAILAGCETDVCVLQSCLGLIDLGYEVYLVEELLFSSARDVDAARVRMQAEGAVFLSYKSLYYELFEAVQSDEQLSKFGPFPEDIADTAV
jgi:nicotinamidase-related amidase